VLGPIVNQLPLAAGYHIERGPFRENYLNTVESIAWGDNEAFQAESERLQYLSDAESRLNLTGVRVPVRKDLHKGVKAKGLTPVLLDYKPSINVQIYRTDKQIQIAHEWRSAVHRRLVSTRYGASVDTMLTDMAVKMSSIGEVAHAHLNIESFGLVDLDPSVEERKIDMSNAADPNTAKNEIVERIYFVRGGKFQYDGQMVNMTLFYNRIATKMYKPAFAEFFKPTLAWFRTPDTNAVDYIIQQLGLTPMEAERSKEAILASHNAEKFMRVTGSDRKRLSGIINLVEHCRFVAGFTAKSN